MEKTVVKKSPSLFQFSDDYQANRFYTILKDRLKYSRRSMVDIEKMLMDMYGTKYDSGSFSPSWREWSHMVRPDDVILRVYSSSYATIYFKGIDAENEPEATLKDFKNELKASISNCIRDFAKAHPNFDMDQINDVYCMLKIQDVAVKKVIIFDEVKDE